jgi:hypothetical protein
MKGLLPLAGGFLLAAAIVNSQASAKSAWVPLPQLGSGSVELRLAHAVNPRLPALERSELATLLDEARQVVRKHFHIDLKFTEPEEVSVAQLLAAIPAKALRARRGEIYDFKKGTGDRSRLIQGIERTLEERVVDLGASIAYARPHLLAPLTEPTFADFAKTLVDTHLRRLGHWHGLRSATGERVIDASGANEWIVWDLLGYSGMPYDVIVTNQLVASAEYDDAAINSSLRGGVSAGGTSYNKSGRYRTFSFLSTFPFSEPQALPRGMGGTADRAQAVRLAGKYLAHEIGHMLLLLAHPYGNPACVMRPEPLFDFAAWARGLNASKCKIGSSPAMKPGVAKIGFRTDW